LPSVVGTPFSPPATAKRQWHPGRIFRAALVGGMLASTGLSTSLATAATAHAAVHVAGPAPGTIFVANAGAAPSADAFTASGTGPGSITVYRPGAQRYCR